MSFIYVADGIDDVLAAHLNQYADAWTGVAGKGQPFNAVAVNDPINFAISARNLDPTNSRAAQFLKADGTVLFQVDASGVKVSPDGTVASVPVTATATQTLTNKTFTAPALTNPVVSGAGGTPAGTLGFSGTVLQVGDGTTNEGINVGAWTAFTPTLTQGVAVTVTVNSARYTKIGRLAVMFIQLTATSAGTAGGGIIIGGIPAAIAPLVANAVTPVGIAHLNFAPPRVGAAIAVSATQLEIQVDNNSGFAGAAPAVTLANGIALSVTATYETAS